MRVCYGCNERTATCHANCPKYAAEVAEEQAKKAAYNASKFILQGIAIDRRDHANRAVKKQRFPQRYY